jgi:uncharacterized protein YbcV (DUF1398 family)
MFSMRALLMAGKEIIHMARKSVNVKQFLPNAKRRNEHQCDFP